MLISEITVKQCQIARKCVFYDKDDISLSHDTL